MVKLVVFLLVRLVKCSFSLKFFKLNNSIGCSFFLGNYLLSFLLSSLFTSFLLTYPEGPNKKIKRTYCVLPVSVPSALIDYVQPDFCLFCLFVSLAFFLFLSSGIHSSKGEDCLQHASFSCNSHSHVVRIVQFQ